ncbi:hypothetical protein AA958_20410 [Streptomyces sp. CNQ-509]|uniref:DUF5994 family protein n=1 Tax=unclassified Streptomyces TaxID=2593676 RepID=UPI00062DDCF2|nr:DUF5994 family protein [Streptomyces sp. CNQ-509]AKH84158.1 hypothetical protein AA958_20410 [Streptomyces sp. CNQ-509]
MTATTIPPPATEDHFTPPPPRLSLTPAGTTPTRLDGAWWPRSRDLTAELPALVAVLDPLWGRIIRLAVNSTHWPVMPRKIPVSGHVVKVGWFTTELDPHGLILRSYGAGRWDLLVVPPQTAPESAAWLMAAAVDPARMQSASRLMEEAGHRRHSTGGGTSQQEVWDSEGGRTVPPRTEHPAVPAAPPASTEKG